jgi:hypothetical protein
MKTDELRSPREAAILLALLFKRSGQKRARLSERTIKVAGDRLRLRGAYFDAVQEYLGKLGLVLIELPKGGFCVWPETTLAGAPTVTFKRTMWEDITKLKTNLNCCWTLRMKLESRK